MKIEQFDCFVAWINYHRTDDLKTNALDDGDKVHVMALWIAEPDDNFAGDWIFEVAESMYTLPQRDLEFIKRISSKEYHDKSRVNIHNNNGKV